jgi:hypothetical protein
MHVEPLLYNTKQHQLTVSPVITFFKICYKRSISGGPETITQYFQEAEKDWTAKHATALLKRAVKKVKIGHEKRNHLIAVMQTQRDKI